MRQNTFINSSEEAVEKMQGIGLHSLGTEIRLTVQTSDCLIRIDGSGLKSGLWSEHISGSDLGQLTGWHQVHSRKW